MTLSKFALTGLGTALALCLAPISLVWAQAGGTLSGAVSAGAAQGQSPVVYRCPGPPVLYTDTLSPLEARSKNCKPLTNLPLAIAPPASKPLSLQAAAQTPAQTTAQGAAAADSNLGATGSTSPVGTATAGVAAVPAASAYGFVTPPPGGSRIGAAGAAPSPAAFAAGAGLQSVSGGSGLAAGVVSVGMSDARIRPDDQRSRDAEARRILEAELRREEARLKDAIKALGTAKPGERVGADAAQIRRAESDIEAIRRELGRVR